VRRFVILTSYFDESGTHDGSPVTIMAGIMGNGGQWLRYQAKLNRLKARYGFRVFHAKEFKSLTGQFAGWSREKCAAFLKDFHATGADLMEGVTCAISNSAFEQEYRGGDAPRKLRLDTKYGLCFRNSLVHLTANAARRLGSHRKFGETTMRVVLERGHKNAGDAERIFYEVKKDIKAAGCNLLSTITFAGKDGCDPLMLADMLAHTAYMTELDGQEPPTDNDPRPPKGTGLTHFKYDPGGLAILKATLIERLRSGRKATSA
jgi:hypothetical protein